MLFENSRQFAGSRARGEDIVDYQDVLPLDIRLGVYPKCVVHVGSSTRRGQRALFGGRPGRANRLVTLWNTNELTDSFPQYIGRLKSAFQFPHPMRWYRYKLIEFGPSLGEQLVPQKCPQLAGQRLIVLVFHPNDQFLQ